MFTALICMAFSIVVCSDESTKVFKPLETVTTRSVAWKNGKPRVSTGRILRIRLSEFQLILREEEVCKELELVKEQSEQIQALTKEMHRKSMSVEEKVLAKTIKPEEIKLLHEHYSTEINDILLPFQQERLSQINNRIAIRNVGISDFLKSMVSNEVSKKEKEQIDKALDALLKDLKKDLQKRLQDSIEEILSALSKKHRDVAEDLLAKNGLAIDDPDIFLAQSKYAIKHKIQFGATGNRKFETLVEYTPAIAITYDGRFRVVKTGGSDPILIPNFAQGLVSSRKNELGFSNDQKRQLGETIGSYWTEVKKQQKIRGRSGVTEEVNDLFNQRMGEAAEELRREFDAIATSEQKEIVKKQIAKERLPRFGMVANLLGGDLGRSLEINEKQKREIEKSCSQEIKSLEDRLVYWEEKLMKTVKGKLSDENRKRLAAAIGDHKLTYVKPSYYMLKETRK